MNAPLRSLDQNLAATARFLSITACILALAACGGCASRRGAAPDEPGLSVLNGSIEALRQQFNADKDKLRVLAVWSPT